MSVFSLLISVAAAFLCAPLAEAAVVIVTVQGTVGSNGVDEVLGPNGAMGAFGPPGSLAGQPFTLVYTIDDTGGLPDQLVTPPNGSSITNVHGATAVLNIGGASVTMGNLPDNTLGALRTVNPPSVGFRLDGGPVTSINNNYVVAADIVAIVITFATGNSPFTSYDWRSAFTYTLSANDSVSGGFYFERDMPAYTIYETARGDLISTTITVGPSTPGTPTLVTPQVGLWWNPAESGSGYALDFKHGVLAVTVYSYTSAGAPVWYLASGVMNGNTFTSTLDKCQNGQCISCAYPGRPALNGNDGTISITFTSPTSAMMTLPGGRSFSIVPQAF